MGNLIKALRLQKWKIDDLRDWPPGGEHQMGFPHPRPGGYALKGRQKAQPWPPYRVPRGNSWYPSPNGGRDKSAAGPSLCLLQGDRAALLLPLESAAMIDGGPFVELTIIHGGQWPTGTQHIWRRAWKQTEAGLCETKPRKFVRSLISRALKSAAMELFLYKSY